jgi:hypothetical protein
MDDKARGDNAKLQQGQDTAGVTPKNQEIIDESHSKRRPAGECLSGRRSSTLQSLIRAEAAGRRRGLLEEDERTAMVSISGRLKPANLLMCLMACGQHNTGFGLARTSHKPQFTWLESPSSSPELSSLGALKPGTTSAFNGRDSETECSTGSPLDNAASKLKPSSSSRGQQDRYVHRSSWMSFPDIFTLIYPYTRLVRILDPEASDMLQSLRRSTFDGRGLG